MEKEKRPGSRTLLWSLIMSSPGPLVIGIGLLVGRSSTQIADFIRRSAELLAIAASFVVYRMTDGEDCSSIRKNKLERISNAFVGAMMCLGGSLMILLALLAETADKGNVIPGLSISLMGVIANTIFWRKYTALNRKAPNAVLAVQARLYRAKSLVDACVTLALLSVIAAPGTAFSAALDIAGSIIVALYLNWCGLKTIREALKQSVTERTLLQ